MISPSVCPLFPFKCTSGQLLQSRIKPISNSFPLLAKTPKVLQVCFPQILHRQEAESTCVCLAGASTAHSCYRLLVMISLSPICDGNPSNSAFTRHSKCDACCSNHESEASSSVGHIGFLILRTLHTEPVDLAIGTSCTALEPSQRCDNQVINSS